MKASLFLLLFLAWSSNANKLNVTKLDCEMRQLALGYAKTIIQDEAILQHVHDALRLHYLCGVETKMRSVKAHTSPKIQEQKLRETEFEGRFCKGLCIYVSPSKNNGASNGSINHPFFSIHEALDHARALVLSGVAFAPTIVLRHGIHFLQGKTLVFHENDFGLTILGYPKESVWISGGLDIDEEFFEPSENGLFVANLTSLLANHKKMVPSVASLFTTDRRYTRARYPNSDPEVDQWYVDSSACTK